MSLTSTKFLSAFFLAATLTACSEQVQNSPPEFETVKDVETYRQQTHDANCTSAADFNMAVHIYGEVAGKRFAQLQLLLNGGGLQGRTDEQVLDGLLKEAGIEGLPPEQRSETLSRIALFRNDVTQACPASAPGPQGAQLQASAAPDPK